MGIITQSPISTFVEVIKIKETALLEREPGNQELQVRIERNGLGPTGNGYNEGSGALI